MIVGIHDSVKKVTISPQSQSTAFQRTNENKPNKIPKQMD